MKNCILIATKYYIILHKIDKQIDKLKFIKIMKYSF